MEIIFSLVVQSVSTFSSSVFFALVVTGDTGTMTNVTAGTINKSFTGAVAVKAKLFTFKTVAHGCATLRISMRSRLVRSVE